MNIHLAVLALCIIHVGHPSLFSTEAPTKESKPESDFTANLEYIKGRQKFLEGKYDEALPLLEKARSADPNNAFVLHQLAEIHLRMGQLEKAETLGAQACEKDSANIEYHLTYAGVLAGLRKYGEAKGQYQKVLELEPSNQKVPLLLGILEAESNHPDEAIQIFTKLIEMSSENVLAFFYRAKVHLEGENLEKAKVDLEKCLQLRPSFIEAGTALGLIYEKSGQTEEAIAAYSKIQGAGNFLKRLAQLYLQKNEFQKALDALLEYEKTEPDDYTARVKIGLILFEQKKFDPARDRFLQILKEQPEADNVRFYLGAVYEDMKVYEKAFTEFTKVSRESSFYKEAVLHMGFILREQAKFDEGIEFSRKVLLETSSIAEFYDMHASFYEQKRNFKKALSVITDALKKFPSDERLLYFEGALHDKLGNREQSISVMRKILVTNDSNPHALNFLGYTYAEMGQNLEEAEKLVQKALTIRPNDGFIEDSLGWIYFKQGRTEDALARLKKAVELQPEEAVILDHLGDAYAQKQDFVKAADYYRKAMASTGTKKDKDLAKKIETKLTSIKSRGIAEK